MPQINDDWVLFVPIVTEDASGGVVAAPPGDTYTASSGSASLAASMDVLPSDGVTVALKLVPMVVASPQIPVTVTDSAGLIAYSDMWDIVPDVTPTKLDVNLAAAEHTIQATPTAPGP